MNLVLDESIEYVRHSNDLYKLTNKTRKLGLVICKGKSVMLISPMNGFKEIHNPFIQNDNTKSMIEFCSVNRKYLELLINTLIYVNKKVFVFVFILIMKASSTQ